MDIIIRSIHLQFSNIFYFETIFLFSFRIALHSIIAPTRIHPVWAIACPNAYDIHQSHYYYYCCVMLCFVSFSVSHLSQNFFAHRKFFLSLSLSPHLFSLIAFCLCNVAILPLTYLRSFLHLYALLSFRSIVENVNKSNIFLLTFHLWNGIFRHLRI